VADDGRSDRGDQSNLCSILGDAAQISKGCIMPPSNTEIDKPGIGATAGRSHAISGSAKNTVNKILDRNRDVNNDS
jgi:hypothetical protein